MQVPAKRADEMSRDRQRPALYAGIDDAASRVMQLVEVLARVIAEAGTQHLERMMEDIAHEIGLFPAGVQMQARMARSVAVGRLNLESGADSVMT